MMRWNPETTLESSATREVIRVQYLLDAFLSAIARLGARSVVLLVLLTVVVLTLVLGLAPQDAIAGARWCPDCK